MTPHSHGFLILDKPLGMSSAKAVAEVKKILGCKKIGHSGTLDPLASGVLPLAIGEATKAVSYVVASQKSYRFTIAFGQERSTGDAEGAVTVTTEMLPCIHDIIPALPHYIGTVMQTPPAYSAISIGGKRAYALARSGQNVEIQPRPVEIAALDMVEYTTRDNTPSVTHATFFVTCGKGMYVRSLAQDIARKVNSLGYVSALRRVSVGKFHERDAISLDHLAEVVYKPALLNAWVPIELALDDIPAIDLNPDQASLLRHGQTLGVYTPDGQYMALLQGQIVALVESKSGVLRSQRVFNI